jgi:hypothetical protein
MRSQYAPGEDPETVTPASEIVPTMIDLVAPSNTHSGGVFDFKSKSWMEN